MAREVRLWEWLREGLRGVEGLHMRRIENLVSEGDPDVDGCHKGKYFEMELKGSDRPKTAGGLLKLEVRQSQVIWHRKRWRCGGNVWLYIRVGRGREVKRYLVPGDKTEYVKDGVTEADLARIAVLPPEHTQQDLLRRVVTRAVQCSVPSTG